MDKWLRDLDAMSKEFYPEGILRSLHEYREGIIEELLDAP
jgi:hypothetical protein